MSEELLKPPPEPEQRLLARIATISPYVALLLALAIVWAAWAWFALVYPRQQLEAWEQSMHDAVLVTGQNMEGSLRQAESALRSIDLLLLTRAKDSPASDATVALMADALKESSAGLMELMLVASDGRVFRIPTTSSHASADLAHHALMRELAAQPSGAGLLIGSPVRLKPNGRELTPMALRLSAPIGAFSHLLAMMDLELLAELQRPDLGHPDMNPRDTAIGLLRDDGLMMMRLPRLDDARAQPGSNVLAERPALRARLDGRKGSFRQIGWDGHERLFSFRAFENYGLKLVVSQSVDASLAEFRGQRLTLLVVALAVSLGATLLTVLLQRARARSNLYDAELRATSDALPLGLFRCDMQGRVVYANQTYRELIGVSESEQGFGWLRLLPEAERIDTLQRWREVIRRGKTQELIRPLPLRAGEQRLVSIRTAPLRVGKRLVGQVGTFADITRAAEQQQAAQTLTAIFDLTPNYVLQIDAQQQLVYLNPAARRSIHMPEHAEIGELSALRFQTEHSMAQFANEILPAIERDGHWFGRTEFRDDQGQVIPVEGTFLRHTGRSGELERISMIMRDVSAELQAQRERSRSEAILQAVAQSSQAMISVIDPDFRVRFFNNAFASIHGVRLADCLGRPLAEVIGAAAFEQTLPYFQAALQGQRGQFERKRGEPGEAQVLQIQYAPLRGEGGAIEGVIGISHDISEIKREEQRLRDASRTDPLTQLLNRSGFAAQVQEQLAQAHERKDDWVALLYLDLDRFKPVNDTHGHPIGDALLKAVAGRLRHALRGEDIVARLGGDEFAVFLPRLAHTADAQRIADKLVQALGQPFTLGKLQLQIGASVGFCVVQAGQAEMDGLVARADAALYQAKREGRGRAQGELFSVPPLA
ncbi:diguanylate cyclase domain-containing protein [Paucibacter soli]|uniref:diguanylate cyclase domain-containing protein n=1 Tax=Paucibacter soli TaxID=3133433 RepID=UPI0030AFBB07